MLENNIVTSSYNNVTFSNKHFIFALKVYITEYHLELMTIFIHTLINSAVLPLTCLCFIHHGA